MASNPDRARGKETLTTHNLLTTDSMHQLVETGNDLLKPINENPTNSSVPNPFAQARSERVRQFEETGTNATAQPGR